MSKIVIGNRLSAVIYAYINDCLLIMTNPTPPEPLDFFKWSVNLSQVNMRNVKTTLKSRTRKYLRGVTKLKVWNRLTFFLSVNGLLYTPGVVRVHGQHLELSNEKVLDFEKLYVFDVENVIGLNVEEEIVEDYRVFDTFKAEGMSSLDFSAIPLRTKFPKEAHIRGKTIYAISQVPLDKIDDFEYSETACKFVMEDKLTKYCGREVQLESLSRNIYPQRFFKLNETENIKHVLLTEEEILKTKQKEKSRVWHFANEYIGYSKK